MQRTRTQTMNAPAPIALNALAPVRMLSVPARSTRTLDLKRARGLITQALKLPAGAIQAALLDDALLCLDRAEAALHQARNDATTVTPRLIEPSVSPALFA